MFFSYFLQWLLSIISVWVCVESQGLGDLLGLGGFGGGIRELGGLGNGFGGGLGGGELLGGLGGVPLGGLEGGPLGGFGGGLGGGGPLGGGLGGLSGLEGIHKNYN